MQIQCFFIFVDKTEMSTLDVDKFIRICLLFISMVQFSHIYFMRIWQRI